MSTFSLNKSIFEDTHTDNIQLQTNLSIKNNSKKSKLTTEYNFKEKTICLNAFKTIYKIGDTRQKNLQKHFIEHNINLYIDSKTEKVKNRAISFKNVIKIITFINNYAKQNGLPSPANITYSSLHIQYLEAIKTNNQFEVGITTFCLI
ncbi:10519_t:CDS:2 [Cetraspora pellucida]|uniref:10519_t:CDS:1 n=1 Tax=Cetraspora pellucida TaxID=1433469 RepID=A0A9N9B607_9GLOM|nr:10519_t:CDS:2 [Cetraspora pellucida]